ncbi:MAG: hypothetical protein ACJ74Q_15680 [Pyrinomonadaceae bacterium]
MDSSEEKVTATREDALKHIRAVEKVHRAGNPIKDPVAYLTQKVAELNERLERELALDPDGDEMKRIREGERGDFADWTNEVYFRWFRRVIAYQEAYLAALSS